MSAPPRRVVTTPGWWRATLRTRPLLGLIGRWSMPLTGGGSSLVLGGCAELAAETRPDDQAMSALDEQRQDGWNIGGEDRPLVFPGAQTLDAAGGVRWRAVLPTLASHLAPADPRWAPYYNPTLFQALEAPRNAALAAVIRPISTPEMTTAAQRGEALLSLLADGDRCKRDVAVVLDLPGPEAIAVAAMLSPCLDPVFVFANWPHPLGVVPAHLTLGAALFELPTFEQQRSLRPATAAPVFVLDRNRLAPYVDDAGTFDNRYFANLPPAGALRAAGIAHVLYVTPDDRVGREVDGLDDDLAALDHGGLDVQVLALSDFSETPMPGWPDIPSVGSPSPLVGTTGPRFYFGGSPGTHGCFWRWYGWADGGVPRAGSPAAGLPPAPVAARVPFHPAPRSSFPAAAHATVGWGTGRGAMLGHASSGRSGSLGRASTGMSG